MVTESTSSEIVRELLLRRDSAARQAQPERLVGKRLDLRSVALESVRVEVLAHHGHGVLELGFQPRRGVRKPFLCRREAIVGGTERLGEAPGDPPVRLPGLAPDDDQMLRGKRAGFEEVLLLDVAKVREQPDDRTRPGMVGSGPRRTVDRLDRKSTRLNSSHITISYAV